jgi:tetratricopeptide (TPR) repeat protein
MAPARWRPRRTAARATLVALAATQIGFAGCATYIDRVDVARRATAGGNYTSAVAEMNRVLGVGSSTALPDRWSGDRPLAALERGSLQQALGDYRDASRDLEAAEQALELLDLKNDPVGSLGSYLYSDSVKTYKTPPTERLALNAVNLLNYLASGDLDGAAVEARRFQVMRDYLAGEGIVADGPAALGTYLAGIVFQYRGEGDRALRYYEEALALGPLDSLVTPVVRLARAHPYRGPNLSALLADGPKATEPAATEPAAPEVLIVLSLGRVPHKEPRRIPVGVAVGLAGTFASGDIDWLKYGAAKVVVYPELVATPSSLGAPEVQVDGQPVAVEQLIDLGAAIGAEYEQAKPKIIAAALTRMATRAAVAEGVRVAGKQESALLGDVLSILFESTMVALDRPDTRSWTTLPERVLVARVPVSAGTHDVEVSFWGGGTRRVAVEVPDGGFAAAVITEPR